MKLYGIGKTRWNRPYWLMQEMGVEFEEIIIDPRIGEHRTAEFLKLNPHGKLPVLVDGEVVFQERSERMNSSPSLIAELDSAGSIDWRLELLRAANVHDRTTEMVAREGERRNIERVFVVVGYRSDLVREALSARARVDFVEQPQQLGTGHAVR